LLILEVSWSLARQKEVCRSIHSFLTRSFFPYCFTKEALILSARVLPSICAVLCCMLGAHLFLQPQFVPVVIIRKLFAKSRNLMQTRGWFTLYVTFPFRRGTSPFSKIFSYV